MLRNGPLGALRKDPGRVNLRCGNGAAPPNAAGRSHGGTARADDCRAPGQEPEHNGAAAGDPARGIRGHAGGRRLLDNGVAPETRTNGGKAAAPVGAYINSITVEGFRGVGGPATLQLPPGPGLTLVIGRNGSGKSSFAEALEMLFTGDNQRWSRRSAIWRDGWRNLHHKSASIQADLSVEGVPGTTVARRTWADRAGLETSSVEVQPHGLPKTDLGFLGWESALSTYRPFLSYNELGAMLDEGPTKLHDAVSLVLGLDELTAAEKTLKDSRLARERREKEVKGERDQVIELLEQVEDDRARACIGYLRTMALDALEPLVVVPDGADSQGELGILQRLAALRLPPQEEIEERARELREAQSELSALAGTHADRLLRSAELLEAALGFRASFAETTCPVCGTEEVLTDEWGRAAEQTAADQKTAAREARRAKARAERALAQARDLVTSVPGAIRDARGLLDVEPTILEWADWVALRDLDDPVDLAAALAERAKAVRAAVDRLVAAAQAEVGRRQDAWRPLALTLSAWLVGARDAKKAAEPVADLKQAEKWLKEAAVDIRNDRFAPIADEAMEIWRLLRQRSNVELGRIELQGAGVKRSVKLDVTVDGVPGAALGVMSQGELHSLALSLFFPRATLQESPFRFIVIDDPVQSMDPAKVDGLARVLERAAKTRQVIVFTHDDRLPEAVRRLGIEASIVEVSRGEGSVVEMREALVPVERHIEDARVLLLTDDLPEDTARRVVPGFCRLALEAGCLEAVRRRRIGRGEAHADVEALLGSVTRLTSFAALALFDDKDRGGDVLARINSQFGNRAADAFQRSQKGAHNVVDGDLRDLVRDSATLARQAAL